MLEEVIPALSTLGPALGSVVVIGIVCYFLVQLLMKVLEMFNKHGETLNALNVNMGAHTRVIEKLSDNVNTNTKSTEQIVDLLERSLERSRARK